MTIRRRTRRSHDEALALTMKLAAKGPFTPQELALELDFTPNRARQLLAALQKDKKLTVLANRKSVRGKPSQLWGAPGTEVTEADKKARPTNKVRKDRRPKEMTPAAKSGGVRPVSRSEDGFLGRLWSALEVGIELEDPRGEVYTIRLARNR